MDFPPPPLLPPPPPPSSFSHNQSRHHHQRYVNVRNPPNFYHPPFTHHHPPPYILLPPSPHPPSRYTTYPPQFAEINSVYEFNRGNFPSRLNYDYSNQDPILRDDTYRFRELGSREFDDFRGNNRYRDMIYCGRKLYNVLDDDERGLIRGRDVNDSRRDSGMNAWEVEVYNKKNADLWSRGCRSQVGEVGREVGEVGKEVGEVCSEVGECKKGETSKRKSCGVNERVGKWFNERDSLDSDRASDRLVRGVCDEGTKMSRKKMRIQKVRDFDRNELEKPSGSSCKGSFSQKVSKELVSSTSRTEEENEFQRLERKMKEKENQQTSKESIGSTFRSKAKQGSKRLETRMKKTKKKERKQSPIDVRISFKSNALVAKAIMPSFSRAVKADIDLMPVEEIVEKPVVNEHQSLKSGSGSDVENTVKDVWLEDMCGSPMVKCTKNMEKPGNPKREMDIQFDVRGILQEHLDSKISGNESGTAFDSGEIALENGTLEDDSGFSVAKSEENADKTEIVLPSFDIQSVSSHIPDGFLEKSAISLNKSVTALDSNGLRANDVEGETLKDITHHSLLPLTGGSVIKRAYDSMESNEFQVCDSKIKRSRLSIFHSSHAAESRISRCPTHSERLVNFSEFSAHRHRWVINEVADGASETCLPDESILVSLGFSPHAFNVNICICNGVPVLDSSNHAPETRNQFSSFGNNVADDIVDPSFHDNVGSSKPQQAKNSEVPMDEFLSVVDESVDHSENIRIPVAGSEHVNLENVLPTVPQVGMDAVGMTSVDIADCSNISSAAETNSKFLVVDHKGIDSEVGVSFPCSLSKSCDNMTDLLQNRGSVEETQEAISDIITRPSIEDLDITVPNNSELLDVVTAIDGEPAKHLANNLFSATDFDFPGSSEGVDSFSDGPFANSDVDFGEDSSSSGVRKKRKIFSSTVTSPSLLEDVRIADGCNSSDCSSPRFPEWVSGRQENTLAVASTSTYEYGTNGTELEFCGEKLYVLDMDKTLSCDGNYVKDDVSLSKNQSFSSIENSARTTDLNEDELVESDSDVSSCPSSPDDLLLYSDFSSPPITGASPSHSRSGMIYKTKPFNRGGVFTERITLSPGNRFEKPSFDKAQSNMKMPSVYSKHTSTNMVPKLHHTRGKFTLSKNQMTSPGPNVFTRSPLLSNRSKNLPSTNTTKSKTWTRTGTAPVAPTASKLQSCPSPQNRAEKISGVASSTPVSESKTWTRTGTAPVAPTSSKLQSCPLPQNRAAKIPGVASTTPVSESKTWTRTGTAPVAPTASKLQSCPLPQNRTSKISGVASNSPAAVKPKLQSSLPPWSGKTEISKVKRTWQRPGSEPVATTAPKLQACPLPRSHAVNISSGSPNYQNSTLHTAHNLVKKPSPSNIDAPGLSTFSLSVYRRSPSVEGLTNSQASKSKVGVDAPSIQKTPFVTSAGRPKGVPLSHNTWRPSNPGTTLPVKNDSRISSPKTVDTLDETSKTAVNHGCLDLGHIAVANSPVNEGNSGKKMVYVKRRSNQLIATSDSDDTSTSGVDKTRTSLSDGYYKSKKNQLVRTLVENSATKGDAMVGVNSSWPTSHTLPPRSSINLQLRKGHARTSRTSKFSSVWKLHNAQSPEKHGNAERPQKLLSRLFSFKRAVYKRNLVLNLGSKPSNNSISNISHKLLVSRKRAAVYTRSTHGYSLRMSKVVSVGGSSLKWSKSTDKKSKEANEDATRAVATAGKRGKEANLDVPAALRRRNYVSRKLVPNEMLRPGERVFRVGSERYKMDPTRRTLHRITAEEKPSPSIVLQSEKNTKRSYVPKRLFIGYDEYVRTANGNKLIRDPKKRTRILASEKVRWSLRTARMKLVRKKKYCQFFTKFGKCNKDDGKCPFIHDSSKVVVCTKFLNGSCSNPDCKLTHKVMPERMQDCSYFQKGSCSNENCPYRHIIVEPDSAVCDSFLRGYCPDGNECRKKHTYVCPAYEVTGICPQAATCKLHHPRKKTEKMKPAASEEKILKGRYFEGGPMELADWSTSERTETGNKDDMVILDGDCPDYISLDASEDEMEESLVHEEEIDEVSRGPVLYSTLVIDSLCGEGVD